MLKQDIKALLDRVALPKTFATISTKIPQYNDWNYMVIAPCNGLLCMLVYNGTAFCLDNRSTGEIIYNNPITATLVDCAISVHVKKGDEICVYIGNKLEKPRNEKLVFIPFEGQ